ncbi:MAG: hypothetical protein H5T72_07205 [Actinobacteria bacterium]|nr:hypothetical protein [Actinomycetota bacterium]
MRPRKIVRLAPVRRKAVVHAAFFEMAQAERTGRIADMSTRRGFRHVIVI